MNYKNLFYFDIETVGKYPTLEELKVNDERGYHLFLRKIERKSDNITDWKGDPNEIYLSKSCLIPEYGKIICVSMATFRDDELRVKSVIGEDEKELVSELRHIFKSVDKSTLGLCGYYIKGFDIPWLNRKFLKYGFDIPKITKTHGVKPWETNIFDLSEIWRSSGTLETVSFDEMLYELGLPSPKTVMKGNEVHKEYWVNKDLNKIKTYCESDVRMCVETSQLIMDRI